MIRSGDRVNTGTGAQRRRLTLAEAEAGGLPDPFTRAEWEAAYRASLQAEAAARDRHYTRYFEALYANS